MYMFCAALCAAIPANNIAILAAIIGNLHDPIVTS